MAATDTQVKVTVSADTRPYERSMDKAAASTTKVDKAQGQLTQKTAKHTAAWAAVGGAVTLAGAKMLGSMQEAINKAGDLNESTSKMRVIFGKASADIEKFGADSAKSLGMSKQAAYDAASTFGVFGKAAGLAGQDLSKFSTDMVTLSGDLASFYNSSPEEAITAIGAALRGESEPIRQFGVLLDDATLRQRALTMGIIDNVKSALTPQQRALAAQAEILAQTSDAQGDYARTSGGLANSQRNLSAAIDNAKASFGESLLPIMTKGVKFAALLADGLGKLPGPIKDTVAGLALIAGAAALLAPALSGVKKGVDFASDALKAYRAKAIEARVETEALTASQAKLSGAGGFAAVATKGGVLVGMLAALVLTAKAAKDTISGFRERELDEMAQAMKDAADAGRDLDSAMTMTLGGGKVITGIVEYTDALSKADYVSHQVRPGFKALDQYLSSLPADEAAAKFDTLAKKVTDAGGSVEDMKDMLPGYLTLQRDAAKAAKDQAESEEGKAEALEKANRAAQTAIDTMFTYLSASLSMAGANDDLIGAEDRLTKARKENGKAVAGNSKGALANREALRSEAQMIVANAQATIDNAKAHGDTTEQAYNKGKRAIDKGKTALIDAAVAAGMSKREAQKYIDKILEIPAAKPTEVGLTDVAAAKAAVKSWKATLTGIPGTATTYIKTKFDRYNTGGMGGDGGPVGPKAGLMSATHGVGHPGAGFGVWGPHWSWNRNKRGLGQHDGADITGTGYGAKIYAPSSGRYVRRLSGSWHGNAVQWDKGGTLFTYAHMSRFGGTRPGGVIGFTGATGNATGPHLHIQARRGGRYVNPANYLATGGRITGPGTGTSDSVPVQGSNGEWVINAKAVSHYGDDFMAAINSGRLSRALASSGGGGETVINRGVTYSMDGWTIVAPTPARAAQNVIERMTEEAYRAGVMG